MVKPGQAAYVTGQSFFPRLIEEPFASGLHLAFTFAGIAIMLEDGGLSSVSGGELTK